MADLGIPDFASSQEEIAFWKSQASDWKSKAEEARVELDEFQEGSRELEAELETQLEQAESKLKEYRSLANRLQMDNDQIKEKLEQCQREYQCQVNELQTELCEIKDIRDTLNKYVRDLEQQNDDLERAKRGTIASLEDFESRLNVAIERNAFLESELDEKESLQAAVQRMKDETRDLKSELRVLAPPKLSRNPSLDQYGGGGDRSSRSSFSNNLHRSSTVATADSNKLAADCETKSESGDFVVDTPPASAKSSPSSVVKSNGPPSQPLAPSARISALNIVGDLLRKVGALELKLVSCRNIVKENSAATSAATKEAPNGTAQTPASAERTQKLSRGQSTPAIQKIIDSTS